MTLPALNEMTPLSVAELEADFEAILDRVEAGECFLIDSGSANAVVLIPYSAEIADLLQTESASSSTNIAVEPSP